jgi:hypothetical protein
MDLALRTINNEDDPVFIIQYGPISYFIVRDYNDGTEKLCWLDDDGMKRTMVKAYFDEVDFNARLELYYATIKYDHVV